MSTIQRCLGRFIESVMENVLDEGCNHDCFQTFLLTETGSVYIKLH